MTLVTMSLLIRDGPPRRLSACGVMLAAPDHLG